MIDKPTSIPPELPEPKRFTPPSPGDIITHGENSYYLGAPLGEGAFGTVFAATDEWGNDLVAKVLRPRDQTYDQVRESWVRELNALALLRHPNVTFVYDAFECRDTFYLVLERCSDDLTGLLALPELSPELWLPWLARDILQAVHFFHALGYVHKDLHPGNVFLLWQKDRMIPTKDPVLSFKVGDLGISRLASDIRFFGTILAEWMLPPEYLDSKQFGTLGAPVDIYHVGLLFLSLMLKAPLSFSREDVLAGVPRQKAEALDSPYGPVLARALRRHTAHRTPTATALWREIREIAIAV